MPIIEKHGLALQFYSSTRIRVQYSRLFSLLYQNKRNKKIIQYHASEHQQLRSEKPVHREDIEKADDEEEERKHKANASDFEDRLVNYKRSKTLTVQYKLGINQ